MAVSTCMRPGSGFRRKKGFGCSMQSLNESGVTFFVTDKDTVGCRQASMDKTPFDKGVMFRS